ncbi:MAG: hypothetical protein IJP39_00800, partial [Bacteroidales bacterium]|nr:hypothetical protein [Bacteroidales bacterium]
VTITGAVPASATSFIAAYPYKNAVSCESNVVKMALGAQTVSGTQTVDPNALSSVAYFEDAAATAVFKNVGALVKFKVGVANVTSVSLSPVTGAFAGTASVTVSASADPEVAVSEGAGLVVTNEDGFTVDTYYYAVVAPGDFSGMKVLTYADGNVTIRATSNSGNIARNSVVDMGDITKGTGLVEKIDEITNALELAFFLGHAANYAAEDVVKIANDIVVDNIKLPSAASFKGTLDGQGHSIKNWTSEGVSLFTTCEGTLKDFTLDASCKLTFPQTPANFAFVASKFTGTATGIVNNADASGSGMTLGAVRLAVLFGIANAPTTSDSVVIENCANTGKVTIGVTSHTGTTYVGTVVGSMGNSTTNYLRDCYNTGDITLTQEGSSASNYYFGGVAGGTTNGSNNIRVKNSGNVTLKAGGMEAALCLAGISSYTTGLIEDCENTGDITFESDAALKATFISGIAGYYAQNTMSGTTNKGNVTVKAGYIFGRNNIGDLAGALSFNGKYGISAGVSAGGLISACGRNVVVNDCENFGNVSLTLNDPFNAAIGTHTAARPSVGGCVGDCSGPMTNVHNHGTVSVNLDNKGVANEGSNGGYMFYVGGIVGSSYNFSGASTKEGTDTNKYNKFT